jgi:multiple sugar transport system permease protein
MVVISIIWTFLYDKQVGMINQLLTGLTGGLIGPFDWLGDPQSAMIAIIIMSVWQGVGFQMVIFLAGLQGIPDSLYEASSIDGASRWQQFWNVTIPGLRNTIVFVAISTTILAFRLFTQVDVMTSGGPSDATTTVVFHAVERGFRDQNIGYAAAISVVFFIIVLVIALIQQRLLPSEEG